MRKPWSCRPIEEAPLDIVRRYLTVPRSGWSIGIYGAIGEFSYASDEPDLVVDLDRLAVRTRRGSLSISSVDQVEPLAIIDEAGRIREITFCTRVTAGERATITALDECTFDVGIGAPHVDMLVRLRPDDVETAAVLRASLAQVLPASSSLQWRGSKFTSRSPLAAVDRLPARTHISCQSSWRRVSLVRRTPHCPPGCFAD